MKLFKRFEWSCMESEKWWSIVTKSYLHGNVRYSSQCCNCSVKLNPEINLQTTPHHPPHTNPTSPVGVYESSTSISLRNWSPTQNTPAHSTQHTLVLTSLRSRRRVGFGFKASLFVTECKKTYRIFFQDLFVIIVAPQAILGIKGL